MPNQQEIFNTVARHLLTQMKRSLHGQGKCAYRGDDGLKCAAGCLIPDAKYDVTFEGKSALSSTLAKTWKELGYSCIDVDLITDLQRLHDWKEPDEWKDQLQMEAIRYDLKFNLHEILQGPINENTNNNSTIVGIGKNFSDL